MDIEKLDNPTWYSLSETHKEYAIVDNNMKFYLPEYCPFGGFIHPENTEMPINRYSLLTDNFYIVGDKPEFTDVVVNLKKELVCHQMVLDQPIAIPITETITKLVTLEHRYDLYHLVNLVQPGYFRRFTSDLGDYFGIYQNGILVAVSGERMKMDSYTEVSAVVTHPEHTGKGYAKQLVAHTANKIFGEGKIPYLHVAETNTGAIQLYEKLGFWTRRKISFWNFVTDDGN
ncbi:GNAT family N-acetyltransferase [Flavobacterium amniphilum]|uniref:GNAT family N-acetyltransferase n=1 Tax=Flavobacterium amniphilum TaxID=1834035 RepID=UPI002029FE6E|nr:GNAT family N-acetyltransferase [Flavobacterium amniphilum]MCL9805493.1 GNAT family N-acetyltransferase [Flavobacterium amniphilum]